MIVISLQQIAATIPDDSQREQALNDVVRFYFVLSGSQSPSISQLLQTGQIDADIQSPSVRAYNWFLIAQAYARQGETSRANQTVQFAPDAVKMIPDRFERRELLWQMVEDALGAEQRRLVVEIAAGFEENAYRAIALQ